MSLLPVVRLGDFGSKKPRSVTGQSTADHLVRLTQLSQDLNYKRRFLNPIGQYGHARVGCRFCYRPSDLSDIRGVSIVYPPSGGAASRKRPRGHQKRISFRGRWDPDGVRVLGFVRLNT